MSNSVNSDAIRAGLSCTRLSLEVEIRTVLAGKRERFGPWPHMSAIGKSPTPGPWVVTPVGIEGDEQGDRRHHGGPEKALHHYPLEHHSAWCGDLPAGHDLLNHPGAFGENISALGVTEYSVHVGDVFQLGEVLLQVSQARQPCWKLNVRFNVPDMALRAQRSGRVGWYYRVLRPGRFALGDRLILKSRPQPRWSLARLLEVFYVRTLDRISLAEIVTLPELSPTWRALAERRLKTQTVEGWDARLLGAE